jgi:hypothetical protein
MKNSLQAVQTPAHGARNLFKTLVAGAAFAIAGSAFASPVTGDVVLSEGFDDVPALSAAGWLQVNNSSTPAEGWNQGFGVQSGAQSGGASSYIGASYRSTDGGFGNIDLWLITPEVQLGDNNKLSFYTAGGGNGYPDLMEVRFSAGAGTDVSGFTKLLTTVGGAGGYPADWQNYMAYVSGSASGRFAFRYLVNDAFNNADYVGVDTLSVTAVPEPGSFALIGLGMAGLTLARRRQQRAA